MVNEIVSVVVPVFNSERFLSESLDSILNQTYHDVEIIAVNDGSTDNSLKILNQYSDKINIVSQSNQGLASALNSGIAKINGRWLKWFSPDDVLYPDAIEILVKETKNLPDNTIVYSNWELIDEGNNFVRNFSESNYNNLSKFDFNVRLLDGQQINVNTTLIPTSLLEKGCSIQNLDDPVAIDYDFFLRAALLYDTQFHLIPKKLVKYRINSDQLSHKNILKTLNYLNNVKEKILNGIEENQKQKYLSALETYSKQKPLTKKTLEMGLKLSRLLPNSITEKLVLFYLNKIRRSR